jgi:hypothetical protein
MPNNDPFEVVPRIGRRRLIIDGDTWWVYEAKGVDGPSLIFENEKIVRRVRAFPGNWQHLADEELAMVMREVY